MGIFGGVWKSLELFGDVLERFGDVLGMFGDVLEDRQNEKTPHNKPFRRLVVPIVLEEETGNEAGQSFQGCRNRTLEP